MKSVLISIRPQWCELISCGKKTLEVRKTRPKLEVPFKVYIYCTSGTGKNTFNVPVTHEQLVRHYAETGSMECLNCPIGNGKVIGEFICDAITPLFNVCTDNWHHLAGDVHEWHKELVKRACLTDAELKSYAKGKNCFAWNISDLKIYEEPKKLSELYFPPETFCEKELCGNCPKYEMPNEYGEVMFDCEWKRPIMKAPQSWCYVEEITEPDKTASFGDGDGNESIWIEF